MPVPQKRKYRRYELQFPVRVNLRARGSAGEVETISKNVSIGGLLLTTPSLIPCHTPVRFVMTIQGGPMVRPIQVKGEGEVVRVESTASETGFAIAVECINGPLRV
jgi:hypothetical protein